MKIIFILSGLLISLNVCTASDKITKTAAKQTTLVTIEIPTNPETVNPMIYGQMLEDCNDKIIYGGLLNQNNEENPKVYELLKPLQIPIVRWPAGTYIHEYDWENGIGPKKERKAVDCIRWGGQDSNLFGTDEFLQWCQKLNIEPYLNFNMSNHPKYAASLGDALNWVEYVNGSTKTAFGMKRAQNGHIEPYHVKYWCIGNENYGAYGIHKAETAGFYSNKLNQWASTIKSLYPDLSLLGVGHTYHWNDTVLKKNGKLIDFLTIHFYMSARVKDNNLQNEELTLFSPVKVEKQIKKNSVLLDKINLQTGRTENPVRFSVDEWNCRHMVLDRDKYSFTRNDPRRQFDIVVTAGMLNVFIRQSPYIGMANYIFPINGHGLIRTVGEYDAYMTATYPVFELYRKYMVGKKINLDVAGAGKELSLDKLAVEGNLDKDISGNLQLTYVDGAAVLTDEGNIHMVLVNRSHNESQSVKVQIPEGYVPVRVWKLESNDINMANTPDSRENITIRNIELTKKQQKTTITIAPCGFQLIQYKKL